MPRVFILTDDPEVRRFFEVAWEFTSTAIKADVLARLGCAILTTRWECRKVETLKGEVDESIVRKVLERLCETRESGMYFVQGPYPTSCLAAVFDRDEPPRENFGTLAHELGHHIVYALDAIGEVLAALRRDLPRVDRILELGPPESTRNYIAAALRTLADEGAASYIAENYIVGLKTWPAKYFFRHISVAHQVEIILLLHEAYHECEKAGRRDLAREVRELLNDVRLEAYTNTLYAIHEIARRAFARWPRDVFEENRERYEVLFREL